METEATNYMTTFLGFEEVELSRPVNGKKKVKVKCLPVRKLAEYAALFDIEPELVELCTDLTAEEIDMLLPEDCGRLFEKAHELNFNPFSAWLQRKTKALRMKSQIYGASLPKQQQSADNGDEPAGSPAGLSQIQG